MPSPWNDATDRQLLLTIIHILSPSPPKWDQVAKLMGEGFTAESTRQHYQKLRKDSRTQLGASAGDGTGSPGQQKTTTTTPRKGKTANGTPTSANKSTGKRKGAGAKGGRDDDDEHDVSSEESPTKKFKGVKVEDGSDDWDLA